MRKDNKNIYAYIVTEDGRILHHKIISMIFDSFLEEDAQIMDIGMGGAYNMPIYLLGEVEAHRDEAVVIRVLIEDDLVKVMIFMEDEEMDVLMAALESADENDDSFEICRRVREAKENA